MFTELIDTLQECRHAVIKAAIPENPNNAVALGEEVKHGLVLEPFDAGVGALENQPMGAKGEAQDSSNLCDEMRRKSACGGGCEEEAG